MHVATSSSCQHTYMTESREVQLWEGAGKPGHGSLRHGCSAMSQTPGIYRLSHLFTAGLSSTGLFRKSRWGQAPQQEPAAPAGPPGVRPHSTESFIQPVLPEHMPQTQLWARKGGTRGGWAGETEGSVAAREEQSSVEAGIG